MNCKDCKYNIQTQIKDPEKTIITCHRFPPSVAMTTHHILTQHPIVAEDDFCFEFVAREGY